MTVNVRDESLGRDLEVVEVTRMQVVGVLVLHPQVEAHLEHLLARAGRILRSSWTRP